MDKDNQILTIADFALRYGTINAEQFKQLGHIYKQKIKLGESADYGDLLLTQRFATNYQVGLLKLIQDYSILKKQGEAFGKIAVEKGFATPEDVQKALEHQKKEFKRAKIKKLIGDILVESRVITVKQKNMILKEQTFLENQANKIFSDENALYPPAEELPPETEPVVPLSPYDKQFLKIKVLDQEFAASLVEKKIASKKDVVVAQKIQEDEFEKDNNIRILGDIMVELNLISEDQKDLVLKEQQRLDSSQNREVESGLRMSISRDQMEAKINIKKNASIVTLSDIKALITDHKIKYGVYPDPVLQCHLDERRSSFIVARQNYSFERIKDLKTDYQFNTGMIDTEPKDKGATLAQQKITTTTRVKKNLFGENIEHTSGYATPFRCGTGTRLSKDKTKVFAGKTGFPSLSLDKRLYIHPSISVLEDADLKYGALEPYANLSILGVLTGAYPVTAGNIEAREIRGAAVKAVGTVTSQIGITEAVLNVQGDLHARYIHASTVYACGNIYIENEIIDSQVFCSGAVISPKCRIIATDIYAKQGVELAGAGNERTRPCLIGAGTEHHLLQLTDYINTEIDTIRSQLNDLSEEKEEQEKYSNKIFQKMIELKIFHDRAKKKKEMLSIKFKKKKGKYKKEKLKNIATLVSNFQNRMASSVKSLRELNQTKKNYDKKKKLLANKIKKLEPKIENEIYDLKIDLVNYFEWARKNKNVPQIKISGEISSGTIFKGIYSSLELTSSEKNIFVFEKQISKNNFEMAVQKK